MEPELLRYYSSVVWSGLQDWKIANTPCNFVTRLFFFFPLPLQKQNSRKFDSHSTPVRVRALQNLCPYRFSWKNTKAHGSLQVFCSTAYLLYVCKPSNFTWLPALQTHSSSIYWLNQYLTGSCDARSRTLTVCRPAEEEGFLIVLYWQPGKILVLELFKIWWGSITSLMEPLNVNTLTAPKASSYWVKKHLKWINWLCVGYSISFFLPFLNLDYSSIKPSVG